MATQNALNLGLSGSTGSGSFVGSNSPSISSPYINAIIDSNGNPILGFVTAASAVNYIYLRNSGSGLTTQVACVGSDPNVNIQVLTQGTGSFVISSESNSPITIQSGTGLQHSTRIDMANTSANRTVAFQDAGGTLCMDRSSSGSITTTPPASSSSSLSVGTAYQNTAGYDVMLTIYLSVTAATSASILLGVGSTNTPTQQTIVSGLTVAAVTIIPIPIYLPSGYYAKLSTSGTITQTISGQQTMPV